MLTQRFAPADRPTIAATVHEWAININCLPACIVMAIYYLSFGTVKIMSHSYLRIIIRVILSSILSNSLKVKSTRML